MLTENALTCPKGAKSSYLPESSRFALRLAKATGTETYCYRDAEVAAIIAHCSNTQDLGWLGDVITALVYTGLRISELAQLRWDAVAGTTLQVIDNTRSAKATKADTELATKTHVSRTLPIHPELQKVLDTLEHRQDGSVFHGPRGGALKPDVVRNVLVRDVLKPLAAKLPKRSGERNLLSGRVHSFRHYFCSKCANEGIPEQTLMNWLGHRDSAMIQHYYHIHDEEALQQMGKLKAVTSSNAA